MKHSYFALPSLFAGICLIAFSISIQACYTLRQGITLLGYLHSAKPLETLLESGSSEDAAFVHEIQEIRRFAVDELGLKETKNYTNYVALDRDYLAAIVSASAQDSFTRYEWQFPIIGKVPYKGFFNPEAAKKEGERLRRKELDVWIRPVDAFSTLGYFKDPLYSFMRSYSAAHLADLIIHESFHATLFLKNAVSFNEELAEFTGSEGARLYIKKKFGAESAEYTALFQEDDERQVFVRYLQELTRQLGSVYDSGLSREEKLRQKEAVLNTAQKDFAANYDTLFRSDRYRFFAQLKINNAYLELYRLYYSGGSRLAELYAANGSDLPAFIAAAKTLNNKSDPFTQLEAALHRSADRPRSTK